MQNINTLHINTYYYGSSLYKNFFKELKKIKIEYSIFAPSIKGISIEKDEKIYSNSLFNKFDRLFFNIKQRKIKEKLLEFVSDKKFNIIHSHTLVTNGFPAYYLNRKLDIPYIVAIRNTDVNVFLKYFFWLRKKVLKVLLNAKKIIFISEPYMKRVLSKYVPKKYREQIEKKSLIIPNGIDDFWFNNDVGKQEKSLNSNDIKIIYAGRIDKNKNIKTTQKAIDILNKRGYNVSLTVIGKIDNEKVYNSIKNHECTKFINAMPKEELIKQYRKHDIFVMPSYVETFGLVYGEAMSQGLPVVYSKGQGFDGQFEEGVVGYHVNAYDPIDVADGIEKVINNYESIQSNVVEKSKKFNWKDITEKYYNIYKEIVKQ